MSNVTFRGLISSSINIILWVSLLIITGCATSFKPHTLTCVDFQKDVVQDTNKREEAKSFSVLPPSGDDWCIERLGPNGVIFYTNRFIGQYTMQPPSKEVLAQQSFVFMANTVKAKDVDISSSAAIEEFIEKWHRVGAVTQSDDEGGWHVDFTANKGPAKFNLVKLETEVDDSYKANCVRYKLISDGFYSPSFPEWAFTLKNTAMVCRHPQSDSQLIHVMYSERQRGWYTDRNRKLYENPPLSNRIRAEAERTIRSLEFSENSASNNVNLNNGLKAIDRGDHQTALKLWVPLARQGDATAQHNLGVIYENGEDVRQDYTEALKWYRKAAESGYAPSQINLGNMYADGKGVEKDNQKARKWYLKAAKQGVAQAQYNLGIRSFNGEGVVQDNAEAERWFRKAANQGLANAQYMLGHMYREGHGVTQNYKVAVHWYKLAAEQGNDRGQVLLGAMYLEGHGVTQDYNTALKWFILATEQGSMVGQYNVGLMYYDGQGVTQDYNTALKWFTLAAEQGYADSYYVRGQIYQEWLEYAKAISDINKTIAINPNHVRALNSLAWIQSTAKNRKYRNGKEAISNAKQAVSLTNRKDAMILETLAAAYAEDDQYEKAVETIHEAISILEPTENMQFGDEFKKILNSYEKDKQYY
jgi:TPR repeat protein